ncbi:MAG: hypothetical protein HYX67_05145 [Candidatus Melainabacteria bacterium]|nr:hypothetical protein [Candidatus Melainabacteria bacterium]
MAVSSNGVSLVDRVGQEYKAFKGACKFTTNTIDQNKFNFREAVEEAGKLSTSFEHVLGSIASLKDFMRVGDAVREGAEESFIGLMEMEEKARNAFNRAYEALRGINAMVMPYNRKEEQFTRVYVYHNGPGDVFIRGEGAKISLPIKKSDSLLKPVDLSGLEELSWNRGLPMTAVADNLYMATVATKNGQPHRFKYLVSDCHWCGGDDYVLKGASSTVHVPSFNKESCSLVVPMDVGFGNKLALFGEGDVVIDEKRVSLSWKEGIDFTCFTTNLWALPLLMRGDVVCKICLVKESGDIVWEKAGDRHLEAGKEIVAAPDFGGIGKIVSRDASTAELSPDLLKKQEKLEEQRRVSRKQEELIKDIKNMPAPNFNRGGNLFKQEDILKVIDPVDIKIHKIDGEDFVVYYTPEGRPCGFQQNDNGCTAGTSAMLILHNGKLPSMKILKEREGTYGAEQIPKDLQNAGLDPIVTDRYQMGNNLQGLRKQLLVHGPAFISLRYKVDADFSHAIVVTEISEDLKRVRIQDPWNAWDAIVDGQAFEKLWHNSRSHAIVQVFRGKK